MAEADHPQALQAAFAAHLRDPGAHPLPAGVDDRRMAIYRELFFGNLLGLLGNAFPVLRRLHDDAAWTALVSDFFRSHRARTPLFHRLPEEFVDWLTDVRPAVPGDLPFLAALAHYEWVELALSTAEDPPPDAVQVHPHANLLDAPPRLSPLSWTLAYDWPVHRIGPDFIPTAPTGQQTCLVVYRDAQDEVRFLEINAVTARLLTLADQQPDATGADLLAQIAEELAHPDVDEVLAAGAEILDQLRARGIVLGSRRR